MDRVDRRTFLKGVTAATVVAAASRRGVAARAADAGSANPGSLVAGKDPRLIVHTAEPIVMETPLELLAGEQITPLERLFVRNCQGVPKVGPDALSAWKIDLAGLVDHPQSFAASMLSELPQEQVEMVVQCSGNGRSQFSRAAKTKGTQWGRGGMGNVRFGGVRLTSVLERLGIKPHSGAKFLSAEGGDDPLPGELDFEHSLPLDEALAKSLLAVSLDGEPLPVIHGGPVRLITPGYYGTMHVKWVARLRFDDRESSHTSQIPNYRTPLEPIEPGAAFTPTFANSEPNWRMRLKSVVLAPAQGAKLSAGQVPVVGVAFNDGEARIDSVLVSTDSGRTWSQAELRVPESPYAWYRWQAEVELAAGRHQIWARAVDALGRTQPLDGSIYWNPQGYTWNGVEKIDVSVG